MPIILTTPSGSGYRVFKYSSKCWEWYIIKVKNDDHCARRPITSTGQIISVLKSEKHCNQCYHDYTQLHQRGVAGKMGKKDGRGKWGVRSRERKGLSLVSLTWAFAEQGGTGQRTWLLWVLRHPCKCSCPRAQGVTARPASYCLISRLFSPCLWIHHSISPTVFTLLLPTDLSVQVVPWDADLQLSIFQLSNCREQIFLVPTAGEDHLHLNFSHHDLCD